MPLPRFLPRSFLAVRAMAPKAGKAKAKPATAKPTPKAPSAKKAPKAKADASLTPLSPDTVAKYKNQWKSWTSAPSSQPEALVEAGSEFLNL